MLEPLRRANMLDYVYRLCYLETNINHSNYLVGARFKGMIESFGCNYEQAETEVTVFERKTMC